MKEASGELSMTLIVLIGAGLVIGLLTFMWPTIQDFVRNQWGRVVDTDTDSMIDKSPIGSGIIIPGYSIF